MPDPVSRLQVAQAEIDRMLGDGYARANPQVVSAVMIFASLDWAAMTIAGALVAEEVSVPRNKGRAWSGRKVWCGREQRGRRR